MLFRSAGIYGCIPQQTDIIYSASSDEAELVDNTNSIQLFNTGSWTKYNNPDDQWANCYNGIRIACDFLANTDTLTWSSWRYSYPSKYATLMRDLCINRAEARFLRAYLYFELMKRYGDIPLITERLAITPDFDFSVYNRAPINDVVNYISDQCDLVNRSGKYYLSDEEILTLTNNGRSILEPIYRDTLDIAYPTSGEMSAFIGRATRGSAYGLKAKALIYFASKQFNPNNEVERWIDAAKACKDVLDLPKTYYGLESDYSNLFKMKTNWSKEFLFARKAGSSNTFEKSNYPISIEGGNTGLCPSQNLVDAYEVLTINDDYSLSATKFDWKNEVHKNNPYLNRDPRFYSTIYKHGDQYSSSVNTIVLDCTAGGNSGLPIYHASATGYYLKKYINPSLDLKNNRTDTRTWVLMRMGEFYLYYAEAMNEAYGPNNPADFGMTAIQAVNVIRERAGMPNVSALTKDELREIIYHERQIELAFENQRWWDIRRWNYGQYFNVPLRGIDIKEIGRASCRERVYVLV